MPVHLLPGACRTRTADLDHAPVIAAAHAGPCRDTGLDPDTGELYTIYLHPAHGGSVPAASSTMPCWPT